MILHHKCMYNLFIYQGSVSFFDVLMLYTTIHFIRKIKCVNYFNLYSITISGMCGKAYVREPSSIVATKNSNKNQNVLNVS